MSTLNLVKVRQTVRDDYDEQSQVTLTDTELNKIIGLGYIDTAVKGLCYERKIQKTDLPAGRSLVSLMADGVIQVGYIAYNTQAPGAMGRPHIPPTVLGWMDLEGSTPQGWFRWGDILVIEPPPGVGTYHLDIFAAGYPTTKVGEDITAGAFVTGTRYVIKTVGSTNFVSVGAASSTVGVEFVATGAGSGDGVAIPISFGEIKPEMHECVLDFTRAYAACKLKRWGDAGAAYNRYISAVQEKRWEFIHKIPDPLAARQIPDQVVMEIKQ